MPTLIIDLTDSEYGILIETLRYARRAVEDYQYYPNLEYKRLRIAEVESLRTKIIQSRKESKNENQVITD